MWERAGTRSLPGPEPAVASRGPLINKLGPWKVIRRLWNTDGRRGPRVRRGRHHLQQQASSAGDGGTMPSGPALKGKKRQKGRRVDFS